MDIATKVNIVLCILSFALAVISIITVIITLRQNSKMIESSSRPYLSIYVSHIYCTDCIDYLVLKNFGNSSATIIDFHCNVDLKTAAYDGTHIPFEHIVDQSICPNEKFSVPLKLYELCKNTDKLSFSVRYSSGKKCYSENISISLPAFADYPIMSADPKGRELEALSRSLQDICEKML